MSSTSTLSAVPTDLTSGIDGGAGKAQQSAGISSTAFFLSLVSGFVLFGVQFFVFLLIRNKFTRIYSPRTFLVPEKERTKPPPKGLWQWIVPVFRTSNSDFIQKCGLDAYFFLRYLRTLLKIFVPLACVILPIILPLNAKNGRGPAFATGTFSNSTAWSNVTGLDRLAWGNVPPNKTNRYWGHLILAVVVVIWTCWVFYDELRGYIRLRQAYLTSPQHRLRASATTVLVAGIPRKWCTVEALDGLYDVFPGGIRNIWINRNFDELSDKIKLRDKYARNLEEAETNLIKNCKKDHDEQQKKAEKKTGSKKSKADRVADEQRQNDKAQALAGTAGVSTGNPHQTRHTVDEAINDRSEGNSREASPERGNKKLLAPIPVIGQGIEAVGQGINNVSQGISNVGRTIFGGIRNVGKEVDGRVNTTGGFVANSEQPYTYTNEDDQIGDGIGPGYQIPTDGPTDPVPNLRLNPADDHQSNQSQHPEGLTEQSTSTSSEKDPSRRQHLSATDTAGGSPGRSTLYTQDSEESRSKANVSSMKQQPAVRTSVKKSNFRFWKQSRAGPYDLPSPIPHGAEEDEFPLSSPSPIPIGENAPATTNDPGSDAAKRSESHGLKSKIPFLHEKPDVPPIEYPSAYDEEALIEDGYPALWKKYVKPKDRDTMRLPIFGWTWMPSLPLLGQKVDTIDFCRKELARLNVEIEQDQEDHERFPLMNSAFIQFNHQVAAHMACQAVSHHIPNHMAPRLIEIAPDDVIWDNMSLTWLERYLRTFLVWVLIGGLVIGWAIPVSFTGLLSQVDYLADTYSWLEWLQRAPSWALAAIKGVLPTALLGLFLLLLPLILRFLAKQQGVQTGNLLELAVQNFYFLFSFIQVFLVVSLSSGLTATIQRLTNSPQDVPSILAANLPKSSNYFFSYMLLQALTVSSGALLQLGSLIGWFILAPINDSTARQKWARQLDLPTTRWGTFFPVYTNLASIGLIYSVISPLILIFNIVAFGAFWIVYRYNTLYVTKFRHDTGGLLFPKAINHLFTGLYVMELCLVGLFFLVQEADKDGHAYGTPCKGQAIIMIVVLIFTAGYQWLLNRAFSPLFQYLPITLEDDAVIRDEAFARSQGKKWGLTDGENERESEDINDTLEAKERREREQDARDEQIELQEIEARKRGQKSKLTAIVPGAISNFIPTKGSWARTTRPTKWSNDSRHSMSQQSVPQVQKPTTSLRHRHRHRHQPREHVTAADVEAQISLPKHSSTMIGEALFSGFNDEIEDLTPDERDKLVQRAFQHAALRARRPVIWIPRDELGVSDDEIKRTRRAAGKNIWISNEFTGLDAKGRVVFGRSPPDFSEVDLIEL